MRGSAGREHPATLALRAGSIDALRSALTADLERQWDRDWRDVLIDITPYHDAASRLGVAPATLFATAAATVPERIAEVARTFGARTDVTLGVFGWSLAETPDGPAYRFAWPRWSPPKRPAT